MKPCILRDIAMRLTRETLLLIFAGTDTSAFLIAKSMVYLAKHPEWLKALTEEQDRLIAEYGEEMSPKVQLIPPSNAFEP